LLSRISAYEFEEWIEFTILEREDEEARAAALKKKETPDANDDDED